MPPSYKMSKSTIAIIAAVSAGTGAAITATIMSSSKKDHPPQPPAKATATAPIPPIQPPSLIQPPLSPKRTPSPSPVDLSGLFQYGFPGPISDMATRASLISSYDRRLRNPNWVAEHITPESLSASVGDRKGSQFQEDPLIPAAFRGTLNSYFRSGYDRGHQVPAADAKWSQQAMNDTFYLSNMCPQVGDGFNRDYWAHFEDFCRRLTHKYPSVRIVTGPLYLPRQDPNDKKWYTRYEVIGNPPSIAVPTHFYKVIFAEDGNEGGKVALGAFVLPNAKISNDKPLADFEVPVEAVERASGLEFASKLPKERRRMLCAEISCSIKVREFAQKQKGVQKK